jgi:hypothetical protein
MKAVINKSPDNKNQAVASETSQRHSISQSNFQFSDNRTESVFQRKITELIQKSNHVKQLESKGASSSIEVNDQRNSKIFQLAAKFETIKKKAISGSAPLTQKEIEDATIEVILELVDQFDYRDSNGNSVKDRVGQGLTFIFDADYGATEGMIMLPSIAGVTKDIKDDVFKMALSHEMSHYIRKKGIQSEDQSFPEAEEVINALDFDKELLKYPQGDKNNWKEEVRADLKGIQLEYNSSNKLPGDSEIQAFQTMLGPVVDNAHPPAAFRGNAMKLYKTKITPSKKGGCFLTTACTQTKGLQDDCEELTLLRQFRDNYLLKQPNGTALFDLYYKYSPKIIDKIEASNEKEIIYEYIFVVLRNCIEHIKCGEFDQVYNKYCEMVIKLKEHFLPEEDIPYSAIL